MAEAGKDQTVGVGSQVRLNGSDSRAGSDSAGKLVYTWELVSSPDDSQAVINDPTNPGDLDNPNNAIESFKADEAGEYKARLTVHNNGTQGESDTVTITAVKSGEIGPPVADAGTDRNVLVGNRVNLDAGSSQNGGGDLTYRWQFTQTPSGNGASLTNANTATPSFFPDAAGQYKIELTAENSTGNSTDSVVVNAAAEGESVPVADAGDDRSLEAGNTVTLDGGDSSDADNDSLPQYRWHLIAQPAKQTSEAQLSSTDSAKTKLKLGHAGTYVARLQVCDGTRASQPDRIAISGVGNGLQLLVAVSTDSNDRISYKNIGLPAFQVGSTTVTKSSGEATINQYRLKAIGKSFTVTDVTTKILQTNNNNQPPQLSFKGLQEGMTIEKGQTVDFSTQTSIARKGQYDVQFRFQVKETGDIFRSQNRVTFE